MLTVTPHVAPGFVPKDGILGIVGRAVMEQVINSLSSFFFDSKLLIVYPVSSLTASY